MKALCFADLHGNQNALKYLAELQTQAECILVAGDILNSRPGDGREVRQAKALAEALEHFHLPVFMTQGNHDYWNTSLFQEYPWIQVVIDRLVTLPNGMKAWFSPWSKRFGFWNWMQSERNAHYEIPQETEVVVSHGPAYGILDEVGDDNAGSSVFLDALDALPRLRYVITGHIHGECSSPNTVKRNGVIFQRVSCVDEDYEFKGRFTEMELI